MWSWLQSPMAMKLTFVLLHFVWQGVLLLCVWRIASALLPQKSANARYNGALATLCLMLLFPVLTFLSLDSYRLPFRDGVSSATSPADIASARTIEIESSNAPSAEMLTPASSSSLVDLIAVPPTQEEPQSKTARLILACQPYFILVWLAGVIVLGLRICVSYLGTVWLRNVGLTNVSEEVLVRFARIAQRLDLVHLPPIAFSSRISQAMTVGLMRPMVLLPVAWLTEISPDVLEAVLAHELAHVRRRDLWINFLQRVAETVFFYHPAIWMLSAEIRRHRESCCDELAIEATGHRLDYAKSLHEVAHWQFVHGSPSLAMTFLGARRSELLGRVRHILGITPPQAGERSLPAGVILVIAPLALCVASAILFPEISSQAAAEDASTKKNEEVETGPELFVVPPHFHHPPHGYPQPHPMAPPPLDGRYPPGPPLHPPPPHLPPPGAHPPYVIPAPCDANEDLQGEGLGPPPPIRKMVRDLRMEVQALREQVEELQRERDDPASTRRRQGGRRKAAKSSQDTEDVTEDFDTD